MPEAISAPPDHVDAQAFWSRRRTVRVRTWVICTAQCALVALMATGCAKARAASLPPSAPLAMPPPPPRVVVPVPEEEPIVALPTGPIEPGPPPATRPEAPRTQKPRAESTSRAEATPPPAAQPPAAAASTDKPQLAIASAAGDAEEKRVTALLLRVTGALKGVDATKLSRNQRENHAEAQRYEKMAKDALNDRNFPQALAAAEKAVVFAEALQK